MPKILCLHGYGQSATIIENWTSGLAQEINQVVPETSFHFPCGNIALSLENSKDFKSIPGKLQKTGSSYAWNDTYRDWRRQFTKLPEAIEYLKNILETQGPFDGIIGFSQGSAYGIALASLLENPSLAAECDLPTIDHPPFKFAVMYSGCKVSTFRFAPLYREIRTPMLIYYCIGDTIIPNRWTLALGAGCTNAIFQTHKEGHRVPLDKYTWKVVAGFVAGCTTEYEMMSEPRSTPEPCASDWMRLIEETPFALPRL